MSHEEREDGLGELPEYLLRERGGYPPQSRAPSYSKGQFIPPDIDYQERIIREGRRSQPGSPAQDVDVTTVFDARPINARDFREVQEVLITNGATVSDGTWIAATATFTVPEGYIGILRGFKVNYRLNDMKEFFIGYGSTRPPISFESDGGFMFTSVLAEGSVVPNYDSLKDCFPIMREMKPVYAIADTGKTLQITIFPIGADSLGESPAPISFVPPSDESHIYAQITLYGNLLLKTRGLPANLTPGS